ncbi:Membrane-associated phospholipid phosphatase [Fervidobacterium changbaicum]|uniref:Phosphatase PAP2 family protein n=2 Tax=Fervidobacterium TaxID=2422 RepID=A0AAI8GCP1_FERIS|nr:MULTISPECIES: phosphatase PAP2 family protein [Fervidobacterium]AMW32401.1 phosphatase PAP2 family protein [Fervidobacterium islandicum]QAV34018.1 phosphatase PAP2 family protein [Fervidobacterium changbaicum]SDH37305.1 Membrane-associated phospholipid phosphatase [Fervidobacterium changbaicum]
MRSCTFLRSFVFIIFFYLFVSANVNISFAQAYAESNEKFEIKHELFQIASSVGSQMPLFSLGILSFAFDEPINGAFPRSDFLNALNNMNIFHFAVLSVAVAGLVLPFDSYTALAVLESFVVSAAITGVVKFLVGRARPYVSDSPYTFKFFSTDEAYQSFPSGHSALSWAIFTPVAKKFGEFWYSIPTLFALQRLWSNNHWFSDVYYGSLIGYTTGVVFYDSKSQ